MCQSWSKVVQDGPKWDYSYEGWLKIRPNKYTVFFDVSTTPVASGQDEPFDLIEEYLVILK